MTYAGNQYIAYNFTYDANNRMTGVTDSNTGPSNTSMIVWEAGQP